MTRTKTKESDARSFRIRQDICARMDKYSDTSHIPRTAIVEMALEEFLDRVGAERVEDDIMTANDAHPLWNQPAQAQPVSESSSVSNVPPYNSYNRPAIRKSMLQQTDFSLLQKMNGRK